MTYDEAASMAAHDAGATTQVALEEGESPVDPFIHRPGEKLPNGATIVACRRVEANPPYHIMLAMWLRGRNDCEYVTWASDLEGECYWGHYHNEDIGDAVVDYLARPAGHPSGA